MRTDAPSPSGRRPGQLLADVLSGAGIASRPATWDDYDAMRRVHHAAYRDVVVRQFGRWELRKQDRLFRRSWEPEAFTILLRPCAACGYARVEDEGDRLRLIELVVAPAHQGRGIGTAIVAALLARAGARGVSVELQVLRENRVANLYGRAGFRAVGRTDTHLVMAWAPDDGSA